MESIRGGQAAELSSCVPASSSPTWRVQPVCRSIPTGRLVTAWAPSLTWYAQHQTDVLLRKIFESSRAKY